MGKDGSGRRAEEGGLAGVERSVYGRRYGRPMRRERREALEQHLSKIQIELPSEGQLDLKSVFGPEISEVWLEIGAGNGDHAVWQAERNPHIGVLAVEPYMNGVANLTVAARKRGLANIRVLADDARLLLARLPPGSISRTFILFPDPWPKRRHWRRRIICEDVLDRVAEAMPRGAELRIGTDHADYLVWILRVLQRHPAFHWRPTCAADWKQRPDDWPETRFEAKGWEAGRASTYLSLTRA